ncbi:hypothetical protein NSB25_21690 [Acetatifactor muris]|uniref:Glycosyltransferase RgtA/B/C/D-like domain-containing protein n=1 Tax=Acetatifactor muris TaxID=879566 RepID=A0A2K4ZMC3_9FIRM|nr:hypothetical protein [Acetatifactor muris]MCR2049872.1 hypothetical protein [Acetatifactor muris]SOY31639.1 hypothetical protein AMURIS_04384 [Acetatifactor muris]
MKLKREKIIYIALTVMAVFCGVIWSVTNIAHDCAYQISMSWRLLSGDRMFLEMWEPHQTSVFLPAVLMWIYEKIFHTTTGIVLYLQICGILIRGAIAFLLYRILGKALKKPVAYGMALLFFMISPKDYALPEFANMQLWYSALLFCCLYGYLRSGKRMLLAAGAICLCLEVLAYPSCLIVYFGIAGLLACYSENRKKDILLFTGICVGLGSAVGGYFLFSLGSDTFRQCLEGMLALEPSHTVGMGDKLVGYLKDILKVLPVFLIVGAGGFGISRLFLLFGRAGKGMATKKGQAKGQLWFLCSAAIFLAGFFLNILSVENRTAYSLIFLFLAAAGLWNVKVLAGEEKRIYMCLSVIGGLGFGATLLLSDMPLYPSAAYGLLAVIAALIPIAGGEISEGTRKGLFSCFICFVVLLAFRCVYIRTPMTGRGQICSVLSDLSVVRVGPAWGIITDELGACIQRDSYPEWKEWIRPGDRVWIIGSVVDTLGYLYEDVETAGPSTMSTPSYSDAVLEYWRLNPDKYPDVVVAESYMGNLAYELQINEWLQSWLEEEYQPEQIVDGIYWKYYFRKKR